MAQLPVGDIHLEYDTFGDADGTPLLLIMGLGAQMIHWDEDFCQQLADKGHYVIRHDNRDSGLSTQSEGEFDMMALMADFLAGNTPDVPYTLDDMAADSVGLLEQLGIEQAHICGASMGGMIAQLVACNYPTKALSLTSIMSSSGNPDLPKSTPEAQTALMAPRPDGENETVARAIENAKVMGSKGFEFDPGRTAKRAVEAFRRSFNPMGVARQMAAIATNGDRRERLNRLDIPCVVIHGTTDPLVPIEGGIDTHENIKGSTLVKIEGMGHDLPPGAWPEVIKAICSLTLNETV
ncbi:MAG: pimeloyl-ACP methyl ester carboxylesterase [Candidatus Azotimanducaceae bacterium]|jgi:pimeloyl-ACP methyl ester carboxylesterase